MLRVLVVDDDKMVGSALARILRRNGFDAQAIDTPDAALDLVASFAPDAIVADANMPAMSGIELLAAVRERRPEAVRILVSGLTTGLADDALCDHVLQKPWASGELEAAIRTPRRPRGA